MIILLNTYLTFSYGVSLLLLLYKNRFIFLPVSLPSKCFMLLKTEDCLSNVLFATCVGHRSSLPTLCAHVHFISQTPLIMGMENMLLTGLTDV